MNQRGVFFAFMIFLLVMSVIALNSTTSRAVSESEQRLVQHSAFDVVNNSFNNLFEEVVSLKKEGFAKEVQQRGLPFKYGLNNNKINLSQTLPQRPSVLKGYIDSLNIYSIFLNTKGQAGNIQLNTKVAAQNSEWGGSEWPLFPDLNYLILPQCLLLDANADGNMLLMGGVLWSELCTQPFDFADLNAIDANISFNSGPYAVAALSCGSEFFDPANPPDNCRKDAFNPSSSDPYVAVGLVEKCAPEGCKVIAGGTPPFATKTIAAHFDPATTNGTVSIQATANYAVKIKIGRLDAADNFPIHIENQFIAEPIDVDLNVAFDQRIEMFYFSGFDINVSKQNFLVVRST
jgi:hypothetical protein